MGDVEQPYFKRADDRSVIFYNWLLRLLWSLSSILQPTIRGGNIQMVYVTSTDILL